MKPLHLQEFVLHIIDMWEKASQREAKEIRVVPKSSDRLEPELA